MKSNSIKHYFLFLILVGLASGSVFSQSSESSALFERVSKKIDAVYNHANIPGLSLVLVEGDSIYMKSWGFADLKSKIPVTSKTLFELGSTSKAFTALAILKLQEDGLIGLDDYVSKYLPCFRCYYFGKEVPITISELLHHTSGIPMESILRIPMGEDDGMLERTVHLFNNMKLKRLPGSDYEYATINYDILGLIIEKISKLSFEDYLKEKIFNPLKFEYTTVGKPVNANFAKGYKIGFFAPREYDAPRYRGNNPAGYVISNAEDMAKWLRYQLSLNANCFEGIIKRSHLPDFTVRPNGLSSYALGWQVEPYGVNKIYHSGLNPNYTSFIGFLPNKKAGVAS